MTAPAPTVSAAPAGPITLYRVQTVRRGRWLGLCKDPQRAEEWRAVQQAALKEEVEVKPITVDPRLPVLLHFEEVS